MASKKHPYFAVSFRSIHGRVQRHFRLYSAMRVVRWSLKREHSARGHEETGLCINETNVLPCSPIIKNCDHAKKIVVALDAIDS